MQEKILCKRRFYVREVQPIYKWAQHATVRHYWSVHFKKNKKKTTPCASSVICDSVSKWVFWFQEIFTYEKIFNLRKRRFYEEKILRKRSSTNLWAQNATVHLYWSVHLKN